MVSLLHRWDLTPREAVALQRDLRGEVLITPLARDIRLIGGADISFNRFSNTIHAGIVLLRLSDMTVVETASVRTEAEFPYVPGLLSFREAPAILEAWERLATKPDLLMLDGHGLAHPRRFGIACHIGLLLDLPTIGCAKSLLAGHYEEPCMESGCRAPLLHRSPETGGEEVIGVVLRTKRRVSPVFVSAGHLIDIDGAVDLVMRSVTRYRQPEPTRQAHLLVNRLRREYDLAVKAGASQG